MKFGNNFIENYKIIKELGQGTYSKVFLAEEILIKNLVSIKVISKVKIKSEYEQLRYNSEVAIMKKSYHPFLIKLFEELEDVNNKYLVMEYCPNGTLYELIQKNGKLEENIAKKYFIQLVSVIDYLHNNLYISHRDLKPQNILLDQYNNIRLIDFGLSKSFSEDDNDFSTKCGSPAYIAPEIAKGQKYSKIADIWSCGVILFYLVTGKLPFEESNLSSLYDQILFKDLNYPNYLSNSLKDLLKIMFQRKPENRATIEQIKKHNWIIESEFQELLYFQCENKENFNENILEILKNYQIEPKKIKEQINTQQITYLTSIYFQILNQNLILKIKEKIETLNKQNNENIIKPITNIKIKPISYSPQKLSFLKSKSNILKTPNLSNLIEKRFSKQLDIK